MSSIVASASLEADLRPHLAGAGERLAHGERVVDVGEHVERRIAWRVQRGERRLDLRLRRRRIGRLLGAGRWEPDGERVVIGVHRVRRRRPAPR